MKPEEAAARRDPSRIDFTGQIQILLENATYGGHHEVILTANTIDWQVTEFLGGHQCHRLAGALNFLTGWDIVTFDVFLGGTWTPTHSGVVTPNGDVLDIYGCTKLAAVKRKYRRDNSCPVRSRIVAVDLMPGDVLTGIDYLRGDRLWWAAEGPIEMLAVLMHFARLLVRLSRN